MDVEARQLDSYNLQNVDFIKLDIQGGELNALKGSQKTLQSTLGLEIEVEFLPMYQGQPFFGDILNLLEERDFEFIDFVNLTRWERVSHNGFGQLIFGDALFLKTPEFFMACNPPIEKIASYFAILLLYKRFDLLELSFGYLPDDKSIELENFYQACRPIINSDRAIRKVHQLYARALNIMGLQYRPYLLY